MTCSLMMDNADEGSRWRWTIAGKSNLPVLNNVACRSKVSSTQSLSPPISRTDSDSPLHRGGELCFVASTNPITADDWMNLGSFVHDILVAYPAVT
jgi:hypothetical protein